MLQDLERGDGVEGATVGVRFRFFHRRTDVADIRAGAQLVRDGDIAVADVHADDLVPAKAAIRR